MPAGSSLEPRLDVLRDRLASLGSQVRSHYTSPCIEHYRRVAERLDRLAHNDEVLPIAGFCHGAWGLVDPDELASIAGAEVRSVLHNWARLQQLPFDELDAAVKEDTRAAFLCVYDRLDRVDPDDTLIAISAADWAPVVGRVAELGADEAERFIHSARATAHIAELVGLWAHRYAIEDIALQLRDPGLMDRALAFTAEAKVYPQQLVAAIDTLLEPEGATSESRIPHDPTVWRWRHLAWVAQKLAEQSHAGAPRESPAVIASCGFALVVCDSDELAYQILARIHAHAEHYLPEKFFDSIGHATKDGYRALHTVISVTVRGRSGYVQVRIQPRPRSGQRPRLSAADLLELGLRAGPRGRIGHIRVSTPRGEIHELPGGAHVLAFAASLHSELAAYATGAVINSREPIVHRLHPLHDGDRVELIVGDKPSLPPEQWEEGLSGELRRRIRNGVRRALSDHFHGQGIAWVRKRVAASGISDVDDDILRSLLEWAVQGVPLRKLPREIAEADKLRRILQELGIAECLDRGERLPVSSLISWDEIKQIDAKLDGVLDHLELEQGPIVPEDDALRRRTHAIRYCDECNPREAGQHAARLQPDGTLLVHRRAAPCARGANPLAIVGRQFATLNQYFSIETTNRTGIAEEILGVFCRHEVDLTDMAGRKLGPGWAIFRIGVGVIGPSKVDTIEAELQAISGVQRMRGPGQKPFPILEDWLPPRAEYIRGMDPAGKPYHVGGEIADDRYFYGRGRELGALQAAYHNAEAGPGGVMVGVLGALKTGKSSLVTHFMRRLKAKETHVVALRHVAGEETWTSVEQRLCELLVEQVRDHARDQKLTPPPELSGGLATMLRTLRRWASAPRVVLVVDEAVRMLQYMELTTGRPDTEDAKRALLGFHAELGNLPRVLLVLVGPEAPTRQLRPPLRWLINSMNTISVSPFSSGDTRALIEARHLQNIFQISAEQSVFDKAHEVTAGDPFWLAHLAARMWERANHEHHVHFKKLDLDEARRFIVNADHIFHDRVDPQPGEHIDVERLRRIATTVAQLCGPGVHAYTSEQALHKELATGGEPVDPPELADALDDLAARGAVKLDGGALAEGRIVRIAAPLLAENLRAVAERRSPRGRA